MSNWRQNPKEKTEKYLFKLKMAIHMISRSVEATDKTSSTLVTEVKGLYQQLVNDTPVKDAEGILIKMDSKLTSLRNIDVNNHRFDDMIGVHSCKALSALNKVFKVVHYIVCTTRFDDEYKEHLEALGLMRIRKVETTICDF